MSIAYISIGSNLSKPINQVNNAIETLKNLPKSKFLNASMLYNSSPMGSNNQPNYVNAAIAIDTKLTPFELLDCTKKIEQHYGRVRKNMERWQPRTLDLDIILFGNDVINSKHLTIPHYGMKEREFVLYPIIEIAPNLQLPDGIKLKSLLKNLDSTRLKYLSIIKI
ncbi:2-amino-4-hydroxy-6-hydroxymethyldihydropteridine pyrophosphokinase [Candidatus Photodesmus katoptron]|uniref:2-amino-4-hydroxy-6-hydroxymethyldihydropteridine pyrophosphokinase n=1 Tax=Candidatus Photodesmus katoptron Akat1 TaxID=1236703 RepID=S3DIA9_9GAMM|nr:2-amino-4-hydroxy-6-hydroxymethyldihydropteridine diphosphokinase [Candidatus Photodesmus katoptron]EPE37445.1 2-amino-4-hydroxy-6-hydroxymethyldihydropteridine pyrophosphokinase [Candidatus Photodesmus katoptron Akat1]KEY90215.1 2-amino-4-hydroxy-6-hydroxymethyldihydropteridine pyrophosphokinase [Candidatus Photodesmus katoptron]